MLSLPAMLRALLSSNNYDDEIYDALAADDTSEVVMTVLRILRKMNAVPDVLTDRKTKEISSSKRNEGNNAYKTGHYQRALALYNEALLFAPKGSREMILAYSNRSALFHKLGAWIACNKDINTCFAMGCPSDIKEKLTKRQNEAMPRCVGENFSETIMRQAAKKCIDPSTMTRNTLLPCASSDIKIVTSTAMSKVIAATNIKVGAVLASEQAYISHTEIINSAFSCHFCQKKELNLIPCEGCCYALFCNEECKNKCMKEYHEYECKILGLVRDWGPVPNLTVKACLKLQKSCKSWDEFITVSYNMGSSRIKSSSIQEIYDTNNKYSVLSCKDDKTFVYGVLYSVSFLVALFLHWLDILIPSFFPKNTEKKQQAKRALARMMMFLTVYQKPLDILQGHTNIRFDQSNYGIENFGLFPFISKLKNSCNPNCIVANNNNKLVLIALRPIGSGEELTVSLLRQTHADTSIGKQRENIRTFKFYGKVCGCHRCNNNYSVQTKSDGEKLSKYQKKYFSQLDLNLIESRLRNLEIVSVYQMLLKALTVLSDVPNSKEFITVYKYWRQCVFFFEVVHSNNNVLDNDA